MCLSDKSGLEFEKAMDKANLVFLDDDFSWAFHLTAVIRNFQYTYF